MLDPHAARSPLGQALRGVAFLGGALALVSSLTLSMGSTGCLVARGTKGPGEPCTRTSECEDGLECASGVCLEVDDAGPTDAGG
jgi:hypothetical protein